MIWSALAWLASRPVVFGWLLRRAVKTPYSHITSADGADTYMRRWWLFNPYATERGARADGGESDARPLWRRMLPSVRIHHIMRPDQDRHLHTHPWNARTIILDGWYSEERYGDPDMPPSTDSLRWPGPFYDAPPRDEYRRARGYTGPLRHGEFHRITAVSHGGVWTLFITGRKRGSWGFDVDGVKVPWREYLAQHEESE